MIDIQWCSQVLPYMDKHAHTIDNHPAWCPFSEKFGPAYEVIDEGVGEPTREKSVVRMAATIYAGDYVWLTDGAFWEVTKRTKYNKRSPYVWFTLTNGERSKQLKMRLDTYRRVIYSDVNVRSIKNRDAVPPRSALAVLSEGISLRNANVKS